MASFLSARLGGDANPLVGEFLRETIQEPPHIKDMWEKLRRQYFRKKNIHNVTGDNAGLKSI
jgi:hypothetical protein